MADRWRPNFKAEYREKIETFLERHEELPFSDAKEFMEFATDTMIMDTETGKAQVKEEEQRILEQLREEIES